MVRSLFALIGGMIGFGSIKIFDILGEKYIVPFFYGSGTFFEALSHWLGLWLGIGFGVFVCGLTVYIATCIEVRQDGLF